MSKALFLVIAGVFVGAAIFELGKKAKTKWEFTHLFEGLVEKEAESFLSITLSKDENQFASDI
jgi:hypothetical protein